MTVSAIPEEGYVFKGWYNGEALVSSDMEFSFVAKENISLVAKFISKAPKVSSVLISDVTLNYKKATTVHPIITADEGAEYIVKYESSNPKVATVDENGKVYAAKRGEATITCTVTDSYGNTVSDTCKVTVNYTFWQWLIKIILFGWIWY